MGISIGSSSASSIYVGNTAIREVYHGSTKIWPVAQYGIYHNANLGLISIYTKNLTKTIADKNLGATSTNLDSSSSYGYYFQHGNNYTGFSSYPPSTTSSQIDLSAYGPGNYYNSSTYYVNDGTPSMRDSSSNTNLRGGDTNTDEARRGPCSQGWHIPGDQELDSIFYVLQDAGVANLNGFRQYFLMPQPGWLSYDYGYLIDVGTVGIWMSSDRCSWELGRWAGAGYDYEDPDSCFRCMNGANTGQIRPFKNEFVPPDDTWTKLLDLSSS